MGRISFMALGVILFIAQAGAQVQFSNIRFAEAMDKAKKENKIILLSIQSPTCTECNEVSKAGFNNALLARAINSSCISLNVSQQSPDFILLDSLYSIDNTMGLLFVDGEGNYLHRYNGTSSFYIMYMEQLDKALKKKDTPDTAYKRLQAAYHEGNRSFTLLYQLVAKKNEAGILHDALTEEMLNLAPADSANSLTFLQFVNEQIPLIGSPVENYLHRNPGNFNDAWYLMPLQKRVLINNRMIAKSKAKAIRDKNLMYAERVAAFAAGVNTDKIQARKMHDRTMIDYYKGINDTSNYLLASVKYYDQFLMTVSVDSVLRADSLRLREMAANAVPQKLMQPGAPALMRTAVQFAPASQYYTNELNSGAWAIYTYTHDPYYTGKALGWSKRSLEFFENTHAIDTYAKLLYRNGNTAEAIQWLEKAQQLIKDKKAPAYPNNQEELILKMKSGEKKLDEY